MLLSYIETNPGTLWLRPVEFVTGIQLPCRPVVALVADWEPSTLSGINQAVTTISYCLNPSLTEYYMFAL